MVRKIVAASVLLVAFACSSPASAAEPGAPDGGQGSDAWRIVVSGLGFVGASVGTALSFTSFEPHDVNGIQLGVGAGLFVAGIVTMAIVLNGDHHHGVAFAPGVRTNACLIFGGRSEGARLPSDSPGLTVTMQF